MNTHPAALTAFLVQDQRSGSVDVGTLESLPGVSVATTRSSLLNRLDALSSSVTTGFGVTNTTNLNWLHRALAQSTSRLLGQLVSCGRDGVKERRRSHFGVCWREPLQSSRNHDVRRGNVNKSSSAGQHAQLLRAHRRWELHWSTCCRIQRRHRPAGEASLRSKGCGKSGAVQQAQVLRSVGALAFCCCQGRATSGAVAEHAKTVRGYCL